MRSIAWTWRDRLPDRCAGRVRQSGCIGGSPSTTKCRRASAGPGGRGGLWGLLGRRAPRGLGWGEGVFGVGRAGFTRGALALGRTRFESLLAFATAAGDLQMQASALSQLSQIARDEGDSARSRELVLQALAIHQATGDRWGASNELEVLSLLAL